MGESRTEQARVDQQVVLGHAGVVRAESRKVRESAQINRWWAEREHLFWNHQRVAYARVRLEAARLIHEACDRKHAHAEAIRQRAALIVARAGANISASRALILRSRLTALP